MEQSRWNSVAQIGSRLPVGFNPANCGLPRPFYSRGTRQSDRRTDRHHSSFSNAPPYEGRGIITQYPGD